MIYTNECHTCGKTWPCTRPLTQCLRCTEATGKVYGFVHGVVYSQG